MANLPDTPVNTALTLGALAGLGLIAYTQTLRTRIESQVHENYRAFKAMDTGVDAGNLTSIDKDRSSRSA